MGSLVDLTQLREDLVNLKIGLLPKLEHKEEKKAKKKEQNIQQLWDNIKCSNIHIIRVQEIRKKIG